MAIQPKPKQLFQLGNSVPTEQLQAKAKTTTQKILWRTTRKVYKATAVYWIGMQECWGDLLEPFVDVGLLSQSTYDQAVLLYDIYLHLWILCVRAEKFVKAEFEKKGLSYPFSSPFELFTKCVQEQGDYTFSLCLFSYREFSAQQHEKAVRLLIRYLQGEDLNEEQEKLLEKVTPDTEYSDMFWTHLVQHVANRSKKNSSLRSALNHYYMACENSCQKVATLVRKAGSFALTKDGIVKGTKGNGGAYHKPVP